VRKWIDWKGIRFESFTPHRLVVEYTEYTAGWCEMDDQEERKRKRKRKGGKVDG
jgi:hypothetical protein